MSQSSRLPRHSVLLGCGIAATLALASLFLWMRFAPSAAQDPDIAAIGSTPPDGTFRLVDEDGRTVTDADFGGQYRLMTFGYTYCENMCPTQLQVIEGALNQLPHEQQVRVASLFVTVDPQRDTPARLKTFLSRFHPRQKGLTGTPQQIATVARAYKIHYEDAEPAAHEGHAEARHTHGNHTYIVYLFAPDGELLTIFPPHVSPAEMASKMTAIIKEHRS